MSLSSEVVIKFKVIKVKFEFRLIFNFIDLSAVKFKTRRRENLNNKKITYFLHFLECQRDWKL
jgi:hypothetical protein